MTDQSIPGLDPQGGEPLETVAPAAATALAQELADETGDTLADNDDAELLTRQFVTFHLQNEVFAVNMVAVREIIRVPDVTRVPLAPPALDGVANLRGSVVPIVSLRRLLGLEEREADEATRAVVIDVGQPVGFVVDRVSSVLSVDQNQIEGVAGCTGAIDVDYLAGMIKNAGGHAVTMIVEFASLIAQEFALIAGLAQRAAQNGAALVRKTDDQRRDDDAGGQDEIQLVNFLLDGQDYGIAISDVQEIVHLPDAITALPQTPAHVLGVMTLRSRLLPLMDLRSMFRLAHRELDEKSRIVVLRLGSLSVGLVVDAVSEVLRVGLADVRDLPGLIATRGEDSDITRVCQLQGGKRLVSIVNGHNLFDHPAVRDALDAADRAPTDAQEDATMDHDDGGADEATDDTRQLVVFRLGAEEFGVSIAAVKEILRVPDEMFWVPKSAAHVEGVINLRGNVLPVIDLRCRMGLERAEAHERQRIMVFQHKGVATGYVVDHVAQVLVVPAGVIEDAPSLSEGQSRLLPQVANLAADKRMLQLLDPACLLAGDEATREAA
ncbi:chemotaxis protein CheW [Novosphingobium sp. FKTRR1]|uniref:chemotaxis protein CheW n=1 Tax=Novosphingobium sp. FKTRR1 TaxID=2879118 RepID=UPI001CF02BB8|nr:chemotaxis protein CheW [Novosphingobium sp. FKTRR1]